MWSGYKAFYSYGPNDPTLYDVLWNSWNCFKAFFCCCCNKDPLRAGRSSYRDNTMGTLHSSDGEEEYPTENTGYMPIFTAFSNAQNINNNNEKGGISSDSGIAFSYGNGENMKFSENEIPDDYLDQQATRSLKNVSQYMKDMK